MEEETYAKLLEYKRYGRYPAGCGKDAKRSLRLSASSFRVERGVFFHVGKSEKCLARVIKEGG